MDFEYEDDVDRNDLRQYSRLIKEYSFADSDIKDIFRHLISGNENVLPHDMFAFEFRSNDIEDSRITRICKSFNSHIFRIQFLNGNSFIIHLSSNRSFEDEIAIINAVAGVGVEVPRSYFSDPNGIEINNHSYFAMLQENINGKSFEYAAKNNLITTGDKEMLLEEMGKRLRKIHSVTTISGKKQQNMFPRFYEDALDLLNHQRNTIISEGICEVEEFEDIYAKLDTLRDTAEIFGKSSFGLTHNDFHPKHVILDLEKGRPSIGAIIHWSDANFSNTFFDFALWDYWCGEDFLVDSLMESYGMEVFSTSESKVNVELTTIASLINLLCEHAEDVRFKATVLGVWQRLRHEVNAATY
ncbi:MAG: phosphotransferase [Acidimicrobiia bacterium]